MSFGLESIILVSLVVFALLSLVLLVVAFFLYRRSLEVNYDSPDWQVAELKKRTTEFGVKFAELEMGALLGKGSQGEVFRAKWRGTQVAVKKIDTRKVDPDIVEEFCQEAEIMRRLRHPCLTLFMGVSLEHPQLCIVSEIVSRGSLFDILHDENGGFTWSKAMQIAVDVAAGMTYLHAHNPPILHRDLKSLNILITDQWRAKVADFGMTRFQEDEGTMTQCGSPLWMAPEMIKNEPYDEKSDVYSFGICLWELYTRCIPYRELGLNPSQLVVKVVKENLRPPISRTTPKSLARLIERCWHPTPEKRPTFAQILKITETFILDPNIMQHKPIINGEREVEDVVPILTEELTEPDFDKLGVDAWRIEDKLSVEIDDVVSSYHENTHSSPPPSHPLQPLNKQSFHGKYRGKSVFVRKYYVSAVAAGIAQNAVVDLTQPAPSMRIWSIIRHMGDIRHPNIVLFMGAFIEPMNVVIVEEEMKRSNLLSILSDAKFNLHWDTMLQLLIDAAQGMCYLHLHTPEIVHPDLSTKRLLVDHNWRVKVGSYAFTSLDRRLLQKADACNVFTAPELFHQGNMPTTKSNVYSFAMIMYHILARRLPYDGRFTPDLARRLVEGERPTLPIMTSPAFVSLIHACWHGDAHARPSFSDVLSALQSIKAAGPSRIDLSASNAHVYRKARCVVAFKSKDAMSVAKDWGQNVGRQNSWLVISEEDDLYMLDPQVFAATYEMVVGRDNTYRKIGTVLAKIINSPFVIKTDSGIEQGNEGDYLLQNEKGDQWAVEKNTFELLYERVVSDEELAAAAAAGQGGGDGGASGAIAGGGGGGGAQTPRHQGSLVRGMTAGNVTTTTPANSRPVTAAGKEESTRKFNNRIAPQPSMHQQK